MSFNTKMTLFEKIPTQNYWNKDENWKKKTKNNS